MSTRAHIVIADAATDPDRPLMFYRQSDGGPQAVSGIMDAFCEWVRTHRIRGNAEQSALWLAALGMKELASWGDPAYQHLSCRLADLEPGAAIEAEGDNRNRHAGWMAGTMAPTDRFSPDIQFLHVVVLRGGMHGFPHEPSEATWVTYDTPRNATMSWLSDKVDHAMRSHGLASNRAQPAPAPIGKRRGPAP